MRYRHTFSIVAFLSAVLFCFSTASIGAGTLDPSFGDNGITRTSLNYYGDSARAVIIDQNDHILVAGISDNGSDYDFSLARYNQDGSLDKTFNSDGIVSTQIGSGDDQATAIALQKNGKIVVAGYTSSGEDTDFALARYNQDGSLDQNFGLGGIVVLPIGMGNDRANAIAIQDDGSIVVAGSAVGTTGEVAVVTRFNTTGSVDKSFGHDGLVFAKSDDQTTARDLLIQDDDSILVTGEHRSSEGTTLLLMRYLANGTYDQSFGTDGSSNTANVYLTETEGTSLLVQENDTILVAGSAGTGDKRDIALFRFTAQGKYDPSFGTRGMVRLDINGEADGASDMVAAEDSVIVAGYTTTNGQRDFVLLEYSFPKAPSSDNGEAHTGLVIREPVVETAYASSSTLQKIETNNNPAISVTTTSISPSNDTVYGIAVQKDNKVVVVGSSEEEDVSSYTVARYTNAAGGGESVTQAGNDSSVSPYIITTPVSEIKRNSVFTGGNILSESHFSVTARGVAFSITPYPVLKDFTVAQTAAPKATTSAISGSDQATTTADYTISTAITSGATSDGVGVGQFGTVLTNLAIGTRYYIRAYATTTSPSGTSTTYYGNQLTFETKDACFIATAAYGSFAHPHVTMLRKFRDRYLMHNVVGRNFVRGYYKYSPSIADTIDEHPFLRPVVRTLLLPIVGLSSIML
jgi:uncharacterized delta-60 repeat protein